MEVWYLADFAWPDHEFIPSLPGLEVWRTVGGQAARAYARAPASGWARLSCLRDLRGAYAGQQAEYHYVVETDVPTEHENDFNAWYELEHLPGLASVPGTVRARRFTRELGAPRYLACYDLTTQEVLIHPAWQALRNTAWSSRVRQTFRNPVRTMFARASSSWVPATREGLNKSQSTTPLHLRRDAA
jgi:hypothetical protein